MLHLRGCHPGRIRHALTELPETLDDTYEHTLREINEANWELAHRLFQCVAVASRPLRVEELAEFLAFDFNASPTPRFIEGWRLEDPTIAVQSTCRNFLVVIDIGGSQYIQFTHFSVKEFLMSSRLAEAEKEISRYHVSMTPAHTLVANACLGILLHLNKDVPAKAWLGTLLPLDENVAEDALQLFPLASYAALHWTDHARFEGVSQKVEDGMDILLDLTKPHLALWISLHNTELPSWKIFKRDEGPLPTIGTPLHFATICRLYDFVKVLILKRLHDVNFRDFENLTPLHMASLRGYEQIVRVLLECDADVTAQNDDGETPLHVASKEGHLQVVRVLLEHGASTKARDKFGSTPLHLALQPRGVEDPLDHLHVPSTGSVSGAEDEDDNRLALLYEALQPDIVSYPFPQEASVQVAPDTLERIIQMAWQGRTLLHIELCHMPVDTGPQIFHPNPKADAMARSKGERNHLTSHSGHVEVALLLVKHGADPTARNAHGFCPLYFASLYGYIGVVQCLVEHGVDPTAQVNENGWTPLHGAAYSGHIKVVQFLVGHGADPTAQHDGGLTPLHLASQNGHAEVVQFLVEHGADLTAQHTDGCLHLSSQKGHIEIVQFFIEHGADPAALDQDRATPLYLASYHGHVEVVQFLIDHGGDPTAQNKTGWGPLHVASLFGHVKIVQFLLDHGADMTATDKGGWTPLHLASQDLVSQNLVSQDLAPQALVSQNEHVKIVQSLLDHGADMTTQDKRGRTPLHFASQNGHVKIVRSLLVQGADAAAQAKGGWTPLFFASQNGHAEIVRLLVEHGADPTARGGNGWTPLHSASQGGHVEIVHFLIENGAGPDPIAGVLVERGADPATKVNDMLTPLHLASRYGHVEVVQSLLDHGADPMVQNMDGQTPLHMASQCGRVEVVRLLMKYNVDSTAQNKHGQTPWHLASQNGHTEIVLLLVGHNTSPTAQPHNRRRVTVCLLLLFLSTFYAFALLSLRFEHVRKSVRKVITTKYKY